MIDIGSLIVFIICLLQIILLLWFVLVGRHDTVSRFARGYARTHWWDSKKKKMKKLDDELRFLDKLKESQT